MWRYGDNFSIGTSAIFSRFWGEWADVSPFYFGRHSMFNSTAGCTIEHRSLDSPALFCRERSAQAGADDEIWKTA